MRLVGHVTLGSKNINTHRILKVKPEAKGNFEDWRVVIGKLTPWNKFPLEDLTGTQLLEKFPAFYENRKFITDLTKARHLFIS
jgi:hypothetical protein